MTTGLETPRPMWTKRCDGCGGSRRSAGGEPGRRSTYPPSLRRPSNSPTPRALRRCRWRESATLSTAQRWPSTATSGARTSCSPCSSTGWRLTRRRCRTVWAGATGWKRGLGSRSMACSLIRGCSTCPSPRPPWDLIGHGGSTRASASCAASIYRRMRRGRSSACSASTSSPRHGSKSRSGIWPPARSPISPRSSIDSPTSRICLTCSQPSPTDPVGTQTTHSGSS